ncbi:unannotated protein [freshwater metagenome]|uniref:Unannotated protein n=1 Tax=freshwater metagenome TaxID=449393 RepID=A0A6J6EF04_9ZZZZ
MPDAVATPSGLADVGRDGRTELVRPTPHRFLAHIDAALRVQIFDIAQAHREAIIEPNRISDHIGREPVSLEAYLSLRPRLTNGERFTLD